MLPSQICLDLPTLDISQPPTPSCLASLSEACKEWGFFYITNHGISDELYSKLYSFSEQIFSLPSDRKLELGPATSFQCYTPQFLASPFYESLRVSGPDFFSSAECSGKVLLGPECSSFSQVLQEYGGRMTDISKRIVEILLMTLGDGFDSKFYETEFSGCNGYLKLINYTPPEPYQDEAEGLGMHTDIRCVTILYPDNNSGILQVKSKEGEWLDIVPRKGSLVVNIGDMLEAWSNGKLRSSVHRVVLRSQRKRLSLAFFWSFEDDKVIFAPEEVVGEGNRRHFKPFVSLDYVRFREGVKDRYEQVGSSVRDFAGLETEL